MIDVSWYQKIDLNGLVSDLAIMLSGGITVPAYTTYTEADYKYLIEDCEPTIVIVSNNEMLKKLNTTN